MNIQKIELEILTENFFIKNTKLIFNSVKYFKESYLPSPPPTKNTLSNLHSHYEENYVLDISLSPVNIISIKDTLFDFKSAYLGSDPICCLKAYINREESFKFTSSRRHTSQKEYPVAYSNKDYIQHYKYYGVINFTPSSLDTLDINVKIQTKYIITNTGLEIKYPI